MMNNLYIAISVLALTAIIGTYLLSLLLRNRTIPTGAAIIHGLFAAVSLILIIVYCCGHEPGPWSSAISFSIAALGGFILAYKDLTRKKIPKWLGVAHGATALLGFFILVLFVLWH
jgi:hypothetical protein